MRRLGRFHAKSKGSMRALAIALVLLAGTCANAQEDQNEEILWKRAMDIASHDHTLPKASATNAGDVDWLHFLLGENQIQMAFSIMMMMFATICALGVWIFFDHPNPTNKKPSSSLVETLRTSPLLGPLAPLASPPGGRSLSMKIDIDGTTSEVFRLPTFEELVEQRRSFMSVFDSLTEDLIEHVKELVPREPEATELSRWLEELVTYAGPGGKMNRGLTVVSTYMQLCPTASQEQVHQAQVLGWGIELLQSFLLVADDIMDQSTTRRGKACWYKLPQVGLKAVNDSFLLEHCVYVLIKKYLREDPCYTQVIDLFHEATMRTLLGQSLDLATEAACGGGDTGTQLKLEEYTMDRVQAIAEHKTSYYSFYLPVALGLSLAGYANQRALDMAKELCVKMGVYFQAQDDYLDCYGAPEVIGKIGTDIESAKCSWLIADALTRATPEQKELIKLNYGHYDAEKVAVVKKIFRKLDVESSFQRYEEASYQELKVAIDKADGALQSVFLALLSKLYKRSK